MKRLEPARFARAIILLDCDQPGRQAAAGPRGDGFDLSEWVMHQSDDPGAAAGAYRELAEGVEPYAPEPAPDTGDLLDETAAFICRYVRFAS